MVLTPAQGSLSCFSALLSLLLATSSVAAQSILPADYDGPPPPTSPQVVSRNDRGQVSIRAVRVGEPLVLDGKLDEDVYRSNGAITDFVQQDPQEGMPATEQTELWVFFDENNLYVGARCWDSRPDRIVATEMRRDSQNIQENDSFTLLLDTFYDRRNGFFIQTNPLGALRDQQVSDERNGNPDWSTVWDTKVSRDDKGWMLEMEIPFKSLRYTSSGPQVWGLNVRRIVRSKNEVSYLSAIPASYGTRGVYKFSSAATLVGIELPGLSRNVELKPYAKAGLVTNRLANPVESNDPTGDIGFDGKLGLTKGLTADFTVNTDFAQVEEDDQQVNLTRFNIQFPEKRDFFLEGRGIFAFGGVDPRGTGGGLTPVVFFSRQIGISAGREVPLLVGGRATGRAGAYTLGVVNIETGESKEANAKATNFSVLRVRRDFLRRSTIGFLATHRAQRAGGAPGSNQAVGADASLAFYQNVLINVYYARTRTPNVNDGESSYLGRFEYSGDRYGLQAERLTVGAGFKPEIGFMRRSSFYRNFGQVRFSPRPENSRVIRKYGFEANVDYITDPRGALETREVQGTFRVELQSGDIWSNDISRNYELIVTPFRVAPGVVVAPGGYPFAEYRTNYSLAPHHTVSGDVSFARGSFYDGDRTEIGYNGRLNVSSRIGIEPRVSVNWIDLPSGQFTTKLVSTRVNLLMSPRMALTTLVQYNSSNSSLTSNIRFRWEYRPGSDFYVVYNDGRSTTLSGFPTLETRSFVVKLTRLFRW